jgi:hypothetical protein
MGLTGFAQVAPFATSEFRATSEYDGSNLGQLFSDQDGNIYMLVDCQESFLAGEVCVINGDFAASQAGSTSRGQIGIIVSTPTTSDTYAYAQVFGTNTVALMSSGVTSAGALIIPATTDGGYFNEATSTAANTVFGALSRAAASSATSPAVGGAVGTVQLIWPYVNGLATDLAGTT